MVNFDYPRQLELVYISHNQKISPKPHVWLVPTSQIVENKNFQLIYTKLVDKNEFGKFHFLFPLLWNNPKIVDKNDSGI